MSRRADKETHHWASGSGLTIDVSASSSDINPVLVLTQAGHDFRLEVCGLDLVALESAIAELRLIKDAKKPSYRRGVTP